MIGPEMMMNMAAGSAGGSGPMGGLGGAMDRLTDPQRMFPLLMALQGMKRRPKGQQDSSLPMLMMLMQMARPVENPAGLKAPDYGGVGLPSERTRDFPTYGDEYRKPSLPKNFASNPRPLSLG